MSLSKKSKQFRNKGETMSTEYEIHKSYIDLFAKQIDAKEKVTCEVVSRGDFSRHLVGGLIMNFETLVVTEADGVARIELNRPEKANALSRVMWKEMRAAFDWVSASHARVGVLSARGKHFTAGIDFDLLMAVKSDTAALPEGIRQESLRELIGELQNAISAAESCRKPILAAIHGACC